jgi:hypothetical protein
MGVEFAGVVCRAGWHSPQCAVPDGGAMKARFSLAALLPAVLSLANPTPAAAQQCVLQDVSQHDFGRESRRFIALCEYRIEAILSELQLTRAELRSLQERPDRWQDYLFGGSFGGWPQLQPPTPK